MKQPIDEIDTCRTDDIVCPFCGYGFYPDVDYDDELIECDECGKTYRVSVCYSVTYSTYKPDWLVEWRRENRQQHMEAGRYDELRAMNGMKP